MLCAPVCAAPEQAGEAEIRMELKFIFKKE